MPDRPPSRVRYAEGQRLQPSDLTDEQSYLVELERRHNLQQHAPGIVRGLHVADGAMPPGVAVDGGGHLLVVSEAVPEPHAPAKDAWLIECEAPARAPYRGRSPCGANENDRTREIARVVFDDVPPSADAVNLVSHPSFTAMVAAEVVDPAGRASMRIGPASVLDRDLFAVRTAAPGGTMHDRIVIDRQGENRLTGNVLLEDYHCEADVPCGGTVTISRWPNADSPQPPPLHRGCEGDDPPPESPMHDPSALSFAPMTAVPKAPPVPGIYSILLAGDEPAEELRIDLGEARENDPSVRMAIGGRDDAQHPDFRPWLQINGSCGMSLPDVIDPLDAPVTLGVTGSILRGPIKADLSDPNFTLLLQAAWLAGLQSSVQPSNTADFTFDNAAPETGDDPWKYTIQLSKTVPVDTKMTGGFERIDAGGQTSTQPIHQTVVMPHAFIVLHSPNVIPAGQMTIDLTIFGKMGGETWWRSHSTTMFMRQSPSITFDASQNKVVFTNEDARPMVLNTLTIDGTPFPINAPVPPPVEIPFTPGANATSLTVDAAYVWTDVNVSRTLTVTIDLGGNINILAVDVAQPAAAVASRPLAFAVELRNTAREPLKIVSIKRRLADPGESRPERPRRTAVKLPRKKKLGAGETMSLSIPVGSNAPPGRRTLVLDIKFTRGGKETVIAVEKEITIP